MLTFDSYGEAPDEIRTYQQLWDNGYALAAKLAELNVKPCTRSKLKWVLELGNEYAEGLNSQRAIKDRPYENRAVGAHCMRPKIT